MRLLKFGCQHRLLRHGFSITARLAWGCPIASDPDLRAWLGKERYFAEHFNGVDTFAPKLLARTADHAATPSLARLKGVMRWRHFNNRLAAQALDRLVEALSLTTKRISVAGGWSYLAACEGAVASAHLGHTAIALDPYDTNEVEAVLASVGWLRVGGYWKPKAGGSGARPKGVIVSVGDRLWRTQPQHVRGDLFPQSSGLHHVHGPLLAALLAQNCATITSYSQAAQSLDGFRDALIQLQDIASFRAYTDIAGVRPSADRALMIMDVLSAGAALPAPEAQTHQRAGNRR